MTATIRISVVVPFYNSRRYIEECAQALLAQSYPSHHYEVIMIDNNSTDDSSAIVNKYPRIKLLSEPKQGAYAARNRGVSVSRGEIIAFTDPDCVPSADWLAIIDDAMRNPRAQIVIGRHQFAADSLVLRVLESYEDKKHEYIFTSDTKAIYYGHTNNMSIRQSLFCELGLFPEIPRGSDVVLVRKCVDRYSCDAVRYYRSAAVRHLEIDSGRGYFRKVFVYGASMRRYGKIVDARALNCRERFVVFRNTTKQQYSWSASALLLGLLCVGWFYWLFGRMRGALLSERSVAAGEPRGRG